MKETKIRLRLWNSHLYLIILIGEIFNLKEMSAKLKSLSIKAWKEGRNNRQSHKLANYQSWAKLFIRVETFRHLETSLLLKVEAKLRFSLAPKLLMKLLRMWRRPPRNWLASKKLTSWCPGRSDLSKSNWRDSSRETKNTFLTHLMIYYQSMMCSEFNLQSIDSQVLRKSKFKIRGRLP